MNIIPISSKLFCRLTGGAEISFEIEDTCHSDYLYVLWTTRLLHLCWSPAKILPLGVFCLISGLITQKKFKWAGKETAWSHLLSSEKNINKYSSHLHKFLVNSMYINKASQIIGRSTVGGGKLRAIKANKRTMAEILPIKTKNWQSCKSQCKVKPLWFSDLLNPRQFKNLLQENVRLIWTMLTSALPILGFIL